MEEQAEPRPVRWSLERWQSDLPWPVERLAAETAVLLEREQQWIQRRTERFDFLDGRRLRKSVRLEITLPSVSTGLAPVPLPLALPTKRVLRGFTLVDEDGGKLTHLTRDENRVLAAILLRQQAEATLGSPRSVPGDVLDDLCDIVGLRHHNDEYPDDSTMEKRCSAAISRFETDHAAQEARRGDQSDLPVPAGSRRRADLTRAQLWADISTRTWILLLARRFILFVPGLGNPGTHKTITLGYELELASRTEVEQAPPPRTRAGRVLAALVNVISGQSIDHVFNFPTRGPYSAASYHAELLSPEDLPVVGARLRLVTREYANGQTSQEDIASDRHTALVHLYASGRRPPRTGDGEGAPGETAQACMLRVRVRVRAGLVLPVFLTATVVVGALSVGLLARILGYKAENATVAAVLVAIPAVYAAYLLPQGHPLVRRFFREFRAILVVLSILPFAAAASVAIAFNTTTRYVVWSASDLVAITCFVAAAVALRRSWISA